MKRIRNSNHKAIFIFIFWDVLWLVLGFFFFFYLFLFRAAPAAYGSFQARGQIKAVVASLCHSHSYTRSEPHLWLTMQLTQQRWILNPLSRAGSRTWVLMDTSRVCDCWAMTGIPLMLCFYCGYLSPFCSDLLILFMVTCFVPFHFWRGSVNLYGRQLVCY